MKELNERCFRGALTLLISMQIDVYAADIQAPTILSIAPVNLPSVGKQVRFVVIVRGADNAFCGLSVDTGDGNVHAVIAQSHLAQAFVDHIYSESGRFKVRVSGRNSSAGDKANLLIQVLDEHAEAERILVSESKPNADVGAEQKVAARKFLESIAERQRALRDLDDELAVERSNIQRQMGVTVADDPLKWLSNSFSLPQQVQAYNARWEQREIIRANIDADLKTALALTEFERATQPTLSMPNSFAIEKFTRSKILVDSARRTLNPNTDNSCSGRAEVVISVK